MRRIAAQARKELTQIVRDRRALALALIFPLVQLMLMGSAISLSVNDLPIVVQDFDDSTLSHELVDAFRASITFHVIPWPVDRNPEEALAAGRARAAIIIPSRFARDIVRGVDTPVQLLIDGSDSNTAQLLAGYGSEITRGFNETHGGAGIGPQVQAAVRLWFNPGRSSRRFYGPGIYVLVLSLFPSLLAALSASRETDQKTILQVYASSISAHEFLLGKIFAYVTVGIVECLLLLALLFLRFGVGFIGDPSAFIVATILYCFCVSTFGTLIGIAIPDQASAMQVVALFSYLLIFLLGGLIFPIANIPAGLRWVSNLIWGRYYIEIVRDALLRGGGWAASWIQVSAIAVTSAVFYGMAWGRTHRMQLEA
ncbi:MAG TPA: ABC transporter permease [Thermoanaerobaculia bacterium]|nr:ABC transporter permease [Thermoanaerobaculia bacterium]